MKGKWRGASHLKVFLCIFFIFLQCFARFVLFYRSKRFFPTSRFITSTGTKGFLWIYKSITSAYILRPSPFTPINTVWSEWKMFPAGSNRPLLASCFLHFKRHWLLVALYAPFYILLLSTIRLFLSFLAGKKWKKMKVLLVGPYFWLLFMNSSTFSFPEKGYDYLDRNRLEKRLRFHWHLARSLQIKRTAFRFLLSNPWRASLPWRSSDRSCRPRRVSDSWSLWAPRRGIRWAISVLPCWVAKTMVPDFCCVGWCWRQSCWVAARSACIDAWRAWGQEGRSRTVRGRVQSRWERLLVSEILLTKNHGGDKDLQEVYLIRLSWNSVNDQSISVS